MYLWHLNFAVQNLFFMFSRIGRCSLQYVWYFSLSGISWTVTCIRINTRVLNQRLIQFPSKFIKSWRERTYQVRPTIQRGSWGINSTLPEKNCAEELFYGFQRNAFSQKIFSTKGFSTKWFSTKCRKIMTRTKQVSLGYLLFLWGVFNGKSYLISQRNSWQTIQVFK